MDRGVDFCVHCITNVGETNILGMIHIARIITSYVCFASPWAQSTDFHRLQTDELNVNVTWRRSWPRATCSPQGESFRELTLLFRGIKDLEGKGKGKITLE